MNPTRVYLVLTAILLVALVCIGCGAAATPSMAPAAAPAATQPPAEAPAAATQVVSVTQVVREVQKPVITTPTPRSAGPVTPAEADWQRIQAAGRLVVGVSSGGAPFALRGADLGLSGFDVALAQEIGRRLGLQVQLLDLAAEGLAEALYLGQVDVILATVAAPIPAAASSRPYFATDASILARPAAGLAAVAAPADLARRRVGVQVGTRFEAWAQANLVQPGLVAPADLLRYRDVEQAVRDLAAGRCDALLLDRTQAARFAAGAGAAVTGEGLAREPAAVMARPGVNRLRDEIDRVLVGMIQDGALARLAGQHLGLAPVDLSSLLATGQGDQPGPAATPVGCFRGAAWAADDARSLPVLAPGQVFEKSVRLQNTGTCAWEPGYTVAFAFGSPLNAGPAQLQSYVSPGSEIDVSLILVAPAAPGLHLGAWELRDGSGAAFGERIPVGIVVQGPTATPAPPAPTPTPVPTVPVGSFIVDRTRVKPGECAVAAWNIRDVSEVYFYVEGQAWEQHAATGEESRRLCPAATTAYELRIVHFNGTIEIRRAVITVDANPEAPIQVRLATAPESEVRSGACVDITWAVSGTVDRVRVLRDETVLWADAPQAGNLRDCPPRIGDVQYTVQASGPRETVQTQRVLKIVP